MIYRTFRLEGRVIQKERFFRRSWAKRKHTESSSQSSDKQMDGRWDSMEPRSDAAAPELVSDIPSINQLILSDSLKIGRKDELSPGDTGVVKHASEEKDPC